MKKPDNLKDQIRIAKGIFQNLDRKLVETLQELLS
jgi:hypothetical protein